MRKATRSTPVTIFLAKNFFGAAGAAVVASLAMSTAVLADDAEPKFGYSASITGKSDYTFRGISLTDSGPAIQPFIEFTYGIGYLDFRGINVNNNVYNPVEFDVFAGIRPVTGPVNWDLRHYYYTFPGSNVGNVSYVEFKLGASITPVSNLTLGVTGYATPEWGRFAVYPNGRGINFLHASPVRHAYANTQCGRWLQQCRGKWHLSNRGDLRRIL